MSVGHLVSKSLLLVAMPTASVESFHVPLPSCSSATVLTSTPAISADRYTCTHNLTDIHKCSLLQLSSSYTSCYIPVLYIMQAMQSDICQPYLELLIPHSVQLSAAAQEADLRAALAKSYAVGTMYTLLTSTEFVAIYGVGSGMHVSIPDHECCRPVGCHACTWQSAMRQSQFTLCVRYSCFEHIPGNCIHDIHIYKHR